MSDDQRSPASPTKTASAPVLVSLGKTAIFPKDGAAALLRAACYYPPPGITGYWTPAAGDLDGVEAGLEGFLKEQERKPRDDWARYFRQVAGLLQDGQRTLFLSYFVTDSDPREEKPKDPSDPGAMAERWKQEPFWMNDGGDTYFRVIFDPQKRTFSWYERNSDP